MNDTTNKNDGQWSAVLEALKGSLTKGQYDTHFLGSTARFDGSTCEITLPASANVQMVEKRLIEAVSRSIKSVTDQVYRLRFVKAEAQAVAADEIEVPKQYDQPNEIVDKRTNPYFNVENNLFDHGYAAEMKPFHFVVYCYLLRLAGNGSDCYPSYATIAKNCGVSRISAIRAVKQLAVLKLIKIDRRLNDKGEFTSNLITILNCS